MIGDETVKAIQALKDRKPKASDYLNPPSWTFLLSPEQYREVTEKTRQYESQTHQD